MTFTAYLIDPTADQKASAFDYSPKEQGWDYLREILGCKLIQVVHLPDGNCLYVDEEGLFALEDGRITYGFTIDDSQPLIGKGIVMGFNSEGDEIPPSCTLEELDSRIATGHFGDK